jgi:hypothetical protein
MKPVCKQTLHGSIQKITKSEGINTLKLGVITSKTSTKLLMSPSKGIITREKQILTLKKSYEHKTLISDQIG